MKNKLFSITAIFAVALILLTSFFCFSSSVDNGQTDKSQHLVAVNEISQLVNSGNTALAEQKIADLEKSMRSTQLAKQSNTQILAVSGISLVFILGFSLYIYFSLLKPFDKLKGFADSIAQGNLDIPLKYERTNYFGKFTWAFDSMRNEITKSRQCEKEAIENNKTVIATLSHDIKTPIASIRAYTEGLQANMDSTPEKRERYLSVLMRKCDEVAKLTNDLFLMCSLSSRQTK